MFNSSVQIFDSMLVPALMIGAAAILLFSMNSKYSLIVNRIRTLKEEKETLLKAVEGDIQKDKRISNVELQLSHLIRRISMVRISIVSYAAAVMFFVASCVLIGIRVNPMSSAYYWITLSFVFAGLLAIFNGVIFSVIEVFKGYRIVRLEISEIYYHKK